MVKSLLFLRLIEDGNNIEILVVRRIFFFREITER